MAKKDVGGLFIPAGIFLGLVVGFMVNNIVAGLFIGLGLGFVGFAITEVILRIGKK
jgi:hypothetical protein